MSYEPTNWKTGDVVTSQKLNKLEQGVAGAGGGFLKITIDPETRTLDKTWAEINEAYQNGLYCSVVFPINGDVQGCSQLVILSVVHGKPGYVVSVLKDYDDVNSNTIFFITDSENGYPVWQNNNAGGGDGFS